MIDHTPDPTTPADLWMVEAIIRPFKLDAVARALEGIPGFTGMTVTEARGFGTAKVRSDREAANERTAGETIKQRQRIDASVADFTPNTRVEVVVAGEPVANTVAMALARAAHTGNAGDGRVFVWPITRVIRIGSVA